MRSIDMLVIHCSATPEGVALPPEALERMHRERGFNGCGYHFYIRRDGKIYSMREVERAGAHAKGYNAHSIGICYEGGLDADGKAKDTRTEAQKHAMCVLVRVLAADYAIRRVVGHRDLSPDRNGNGVIEPQEWIKQCPCFNVAEEVPKWLPRREGE